MSAGHWSYSVLRYICNARNTHKINIRNKQSNSDSIEFLLLSANVGSSRIILQTDDK